MAELTDEIRSFLGERRCAVLATHDRDSAIHLTPVWFLFEEDNFYFPSPSKSRKVQNILQNSSGSVVVDARTPGRERWVSASGRVEALGGVDAQALNERVRRRYLALAALDGPIEAALAASDDVTLKLVPAVWRSWTAPSMDSADQLFLPVDA